VSDDLPRCGFVARTGRDCHLPAAVVLHIGSPAVPLGACQRHLTAMVMEYTGTRGTVRVSRS